VNLAGPINATGDLSLVAPSFNFAAGSINVTGGNARLQATTGALGVGSINVSTSTAGDGGTAAGGNLVLQAAGDLSVSGVLTSSASGTPVVLSSASGALDFSAAGSGISVPNGSWQIYLNDPRGKLVNNAWVSHQFGELLPSFKQYGVQPFNASVPASGLLGTGNALLYAFAPAASATGTLSKVYDGSADINLNALSGNLTGAVAGEQLSFSGTGSFGDRNVGTNKTITAASGSALAASSTWTTASGRTASIPVYGYQFSLSGSITARPVSNWIGAATGLWSVASNWDALPDASNVLEVRIPAGKQVTYDAAVGTTRLQTLSSAGALSLAGGTLNVASNVSLPQYSQTGGTLAGQGGLSVSNSFAQTDGAINFAGPVSITQSAGSLGVGSISASAITLAAPGGSISQAGPLVTQGLLSTTANNDITLKDSGNRIGQLRASSTKGNIDITTFGVMDVLGITTANGNIVLTDTGGVTTKGLISATGGSVRVTANSPLTVGTAGIQATGDVLLVATNLTSAGNIVLDGNVTSTAGSVGIFAANNLQQNSEVTAALDITAVAGGTVGFGSAARSVGHPVLYKANGATVVTPGSTVVTDVAQTTAPVNFVVAFLSFFEDTLLSSSVKEIADVKPEYRKRNRDLDVTLNGQTCTP
jgi:hypothetical protein